MFQRIGKPAAKVMLGLAMAAGATALLPVSSASAAPSVSAHTSASRGQIQPMTCSDTEAPAGSWYVTYYWTCSECTADAAFRNSNTWIYTYFCTYNPSNGHYDVHGEYTF